MFKRLLRPMRRTWDRLWFHPRFRYSVYFHSFQRYLRLDPREQVLDDALYFCKVSGVQGDYLEFGTFQGKIFRTAWFLARRHGIEGMHFYGYDSFEGLPDTSPGDQFRKGEYACSIDEFRQLLDRDRIPQSDVTLVPGWFDKILTEDLRKELPLKRAAVIWVDCDLYESTVPVLEWIVPYLQPGAVLVFDDWFCFKGDPGQGEQRAAREWLEKHSQWHLVPWQRFGWAGMAFLVHRKPEGG